MDQSPPVQLAATAPRPARSWRREVGAALRVVGVLAPILVVAGAGDSIHEVSWFLYYGGAGLIGAGTAVATAAWLGWIVVAMVRIVGYPRTAAGLAWLAVVGLVLALLADDSLILLPGGVMGWLLLAVLAAASLTASSRSDWRRPEIGAGRVALVAGGVAVVLLTRLLGHQYLALYWVAWLLVAAATVYACRPARRAGVLALTLLAVPALAGLEAWLIEQVARDLVRSLLDTWAAVAGLFVVVPLVLGAVAFSVQVQAMSRADRMMAKGPAESVTPSPAKR